LEARTRKKRISAAYRYCFARLVLQLWLYYEEAIDNLLEVSHEEMAFGGELTRIARKFLEEREEEAALRAFGQLKDLRDRLIGRMEVLTAFFDCFRIYEYVLNRVERRFSAMEAPRYTSEGLASALVGAMASMKGQAERNAKLRDITAQLPVRFTRKKFYAMVMERLSAYVGLDRANVEDYLELLKGSVMLNLPLGMEKEGELYEALECLRQADYRGLDREGFETCMESLQKGTRLLSGKMDYYLSMEQMVNDLYVLFLTEGEKMTDALEDRNFRVNTAKILDALENRDRGLIKEEGILAQMEGIQESVGDLVMAGSTQKDELLDKVDRLVSGSFFMPVEAGEACSEAADQQWMDREGGRLCRELDSLFAGMQKAVVRAVMAKVISSLPIVFRDSLEVEEYIRTSLESCTDSAEREASMELLEQELS